MILYADILFLVDLSMDFLTLYLCARLTHRPAGWMRTLLASVLGASGSVALTVFSPPRTVTFLAGIFLSAVMTAVTFGIRPSARAFVRQCLLVWGCGAVTGGIMSLLLSMGEPVYLENTAARSPRFWPLFLLTTGSVYLFIRCIQKRLSTPAVSVTVRWQNSTMQADLLVDSGNLLTDPLTGRTVILVSAAAFPALPTDADITRQVYPVPAVGIHGTRLLWAVKPESLTVNGQPRDALVAAENVPADHYGGYSGTCPGSLL